jgi:two-component system, cell cycle sensor histidine kinase and response regulator CckA
VGAFSFAGIHHFYVWRTSRRARAALLVSLYSIFSAGQMLSVVILGSTDVIETAQKGLEWRATFGLAATIILAWLVSELTHFHPKKYLVPVTLMLSAGVLINLMVSITGTVIAIDLMTMPWGELIHVIARRPGIPWLAVVMYVGVLSVYVFAAAAGLHWARTDRTAGTLTAIAGVNGILFGVFSLLIDLEIVRSPYLGQVSNALWILLAAILLSREHAAREDRLEASEARLAVSEARYRTLIESAPEAIVVFDVAGQCFVDLNVEACRLFGAPAEVIRKSNPATFSPPLQPDGRPSNAVGPEYLQQAVSGHTPVFEWTHRSASGTDIPCEVRLVRLPDPTRILVRGSITDISDRRRLEEQLRQSQKMEAIGQLAGGVAHDFNNLLTVISGYSEILKTQLPATHPGAGLVRAIADAAERAAWLTARLLAFGRRAVLAPQVSDLNVLVHDVEHILRRLIGEHITLRVDLAPDQLYVKLDPGHWSQVMLNLAINARDAMPDFGGVLTIRTFAVAADTEFLAARPGMPFGSYAAFSVSDNGSGIASDIRGRIFEPFFTTKALGKGTGLGLAVVHGIVTQVGGTIEVDTVSGRGTSFTVYLPTVTPPPRDEYHSAAAYSAGAGEAVLLVEDEENVRDLLQSALTERGYRVLSAPNGDEAMRLLESDGAAVDLLVTDMVMPGALNGRDLALAVRHRFPRAKVLFISGYVDDPDVRHSGFGAGEQWLQKPFSLQAIAEKARETLDRD